MTEQKIDESKGTVIDNFTYAFNYTLRNEGVLSDDPLDRGGLTKYGIIKEDLKKMGWPVSDQAIRDLTLDQAKEIYRKFYWDSLHLGEIKSRAIATALFDIGVVRGIGIPPKYAKEILHIPEIPKGMSVWCVEKLNKCDEKDFINKFSDRCKSGFRQIVAFRWTQIRFLKGWTARADRLKSLV